MGRISAADSDATEIHEENVGDRLKWKKEY